MGKGVRGSGGVGMCDVYGEWSRVTGGSTGHAIVEGDRRVRWGTLSVIVTVSPLVTSAPSTSTGTVSTGGLAALGVD